MMSAAEKNSISILNPLENALHISVFIPSDIKWIKNLDQMFIFRNYFLNFMEFIFRKSLMMLFFGGKFSEWVSHFEEMRRFKNKKMFLLNLYGCGP